MAHIQTRLNAVRGSGAPAALVTDGVWGTKSTEMTRWYENDFNRRMASMGETARLTPDGIVGTATWDQIKGA